MMHGYGIGVVPHMAAPGLFGSSGWMVGGIMGIGLLLVVGLLVWLAISASRHSAASVGHGGAAMSAQPGQSVAQPHSAAYADDPAVSIARERFARGEIDRETYEAIMSALRG